MARTARKETGFLLLWLIFFPAFLRLLFHAINYGTAAAELSPAQFAMRKKKSHVCHTKLLKYFLKEHIYEHFGLQLDRSTNPSIYNTSLGQWDKRIVNQASDVPSIIFFFMQNCLQNYIQSICLFFKKNTKIKVKSFECPKSMESLKK